MSTICICGSRFVHGACLDCVSAQRPIFSIPVEGVLVVRDLGQQSWNVYRPVRLYGMTYYISIGNYKDYDDACAMRLVDLNDARNQVKAFSKQLSFIFSGRLVSDEWKERAAKVIVERRERLLADIKISEEFDKPLCHRIAKALRS